MNLLKDSTIVYINQTRQENFEILIGKGFSEALSWHNEFKKIIFICYSLTDIPLYKKKFENCYLIGIPFNLSSSAIKSIFNLGKNYLTLLLFLFRLAKISKIDIIRIENLLLSGPPVYFISKIKKIPYVVWLGGYERQSFSYKYSEHFFSWFISKLIIFFEKIILKNANFVFPVTEELLHLTEIRNVSNKILSPNFVDLSIFKNDTSKNKNILKEKIQILFVGRFEEEKGIKILLKAVKILSDDKINFELLMVGDGSLKSWIKEFIISNNMDNVKLLGKFDHSEMPIIYNNADIFILPSYTEGSPASLIEAMSCGIAVIATSVGLCKKIITNGENGFLVPPGNPIKLSQAIKDLLENKNLLEKFRKNGERTIIDYTKNYKKIHRFVYKQILKIFNN